MLKVFCPSFSSFSAAVEIAHIVQIFFIFVYGTEKRLCARSVYFSFQFSSRTVKRVIKYSSRFDFNRFTSFCSFGLSETDAICWEV